MDPYAQLPQIPRPRDRNRDPRDPREPYTRKYTTLVIPEPFPSTGSFNFRQGVFNERPMTVKEQNFEQFVNVRQAEHDISRSIIEWQRLKAHEEDAIQLWQDLDGNLAEYQRQMRTRDQQAMELQCQRKKEKECDLRRQPEVSRAYEQECLNVAAREAFKEAVKSRAMEFAAQEAFMETVKRNLAELEATKTKKAAAATNAQETPSEVASATDGIRSDLDPDTESSGEPSHSPSLQRSGSANSVSPDLGSPSLPTKQPIDNAVPSPRTSPRQPPILPQSRQNSSNSTSPPRSTSVENSTPPSSKRPSPPESLRSTPPKTPKGSPFVPDPAIWGASILDSSSNRPSRSPLPISSPRPQSLNPSPTNAPKVPLRYSYLTDMVKISSIRYQRPQPVFNTSMNEPTSGEQSRRAIPIDRSIYAVEEWKKKRTSGTEDKIVEIIMMGPPGGRVGRGA